MKRPWQLAHAAGSVARRHARFQPISIESVSAMRRRSAPASALAAGRGSRLGDCREAALRTTGRTPVPPAGGHVSRNCVAWRARGPRRRATTSTAPRGRPRRTQRAGRARRREPRQLVPVEVVRDLPPQFGRHSPLADHLCRLALRSFIVRLARSRSGGFSGAVMGNKGLSARRVGQAIRRATLREGGKHGGDGGARSLEPVARHAERLGAPTRDRAAGRGGARDAGRAGAAAPPRPRPR